MTQQTVLRFAIQAVRLVFLPFPLSFFLSLSALEFADYLQNPERSQVAAAEPGEVIGEIIMIIHTAFLQVVVGVPSLLVLDRASRGLRRYLATGTVIALILSFLLAVLLQAPQFGETFGWMFPRVLLFLAPPLLISYLLAFYLRKIREIAGGEPRNA